MASGQAGEKRRAAVFIDRDGVLNETVLRDGTPVSPRSAADFRVAAGAAVAVRRLRCAGFPVFVVTNQPDLARGSLHQAEHERMLGLLRAEVPVDDIAVCPHDDGDSCACRKPAPGMLRDLADRHALDLGRSVFVGDTWKDVEAGRRAGCRTIVLRRSYNAGVTADHEATTLEAAVDIILQLGTR